MIIFDFDQTLVDTSSVAGLRAARDWKGVMRKIDELPVYPGINELIMSLHKQGEMLAIVTKSPDMVAKAFIAKYGWPIEIVIGYHAVRNRKPHPEGLLLAAKRAAVDPSQVIHVGDHYEDTQAAKSAGMTSVGVTWGLDDDGSLRASNPDRLFTTVAELADFLL